MVVLMLKTIRRNCSSTAAIGSFNWRIVSSACS